MPLTINTNSAASQPTITFDNQSALQKSLTKLSSGSRIIQPVDDAGGLAVSMKLESSIVRLSGAKNNAQNVPPLSRGSGWSIGLGRQNPQPDDRIERLSDDAMKNASDSENYNREFKDLAQIYDMATLKFNEQVCSPRQRLRPSEEVMWFSTTSIKASLWTTR